MKARAEQERELGKLAEEVWVRVRVRPNPNRDPSPSPSPNPNPNPNPIRNTYQVSKLGEEKLVLRERIARKDPP